MLSRPIGIRGGWAFRRSKWEDIFDLALHSTAKLKLLRRKVVAPGKGREMGQWEYMDSSARRMVSFATVEYLNEWIRIWI